MLPLLLTYIVLHSRERANLPAVHARGLEREHELQAFGPEIRHESWPRRRGLGMSKQPKFSVFVPSIKPVYPRVSNKGPTKRGNIHNTEGLPCGEEETYHFRGRLSR